MKKLLQLFQAGLLTGVVFSYPIYCLRRLINIFCSLWTRSGYCRRSTGFFLGLFTQYYSFFLQYAAAQFFLGAQKRILTVAIDAGGTPSSLGLTYIFSTTWCFATARYERLWFCQNSSNFIMCGWVWITFTVYPYFRSYRLFSCQWQLKEKIIVILKLGLPVMVAVFGEIGCNLLSFNGRCIRKSILFIAQSIVAAYNSLMVISILGFFRATSILVSGAVAQTRLMMLIAIFYQGQY